MKNSRYALVVTIRVIFICLNCLWMIWLYQLSDRPATTLLAIILIILQTVSLIFYHNRILHDLSNFLIFLEENDTSITFSKNRIERSFKGLTIQLDKINQKLQASRMERERQFQYLQTIVKQIDTGIIAYDQDGNVEIFNHAARELIGLHSLRHINAIIRVCPELGGFIYPEERIQESPVKITTNSREYFLAVKSGTIRFDDKVVHLLSFQNIKPELEAGELDAWRRLIRIQRHEIINSITPITTLTTAIKRRFLRGRERRSPHEITAEYIEDTLKSVEVIEERSHGLIDFVERFRNLTDIPALRIESILVRMLIDPISILFLDELQTRNIDIIINIDPENLMINVDEKLMEQVLINLVKNSIEAIHPSGGTIKIKAYRNSEKSNVIQVIDNGTGISLQAIESIFVPSFTTKENGSGIGLSISRQIVQMHKGTITVRSQPGVETVFEIILPD